MVTNIIIIVKEKNIYTKGFIGNSKFTVPFKIFFKI